MTDTLAHTHARTRSHARNPSFRLRPRSQNPDHGSRAAASPRRAAPDPDGERGGPRPADMGKRAGGGAAGAAAASSSSGAGLEPAAGRSGGPRSAAAGLLGALHLVMTVVVAAARAEKEGECRGGGRPPGPRAPGLRCHRAPGRSRGVALGVPRSRSGARWFLLVFPCVLSSAVSKKTSRVGPPWEQGHVLRHVGC